MNGSNLLVDTNILIYFLQNDLEIIEMIRDKNLTVSFVSELELLSLSDLTEEDESVIKGLLNNCTIWDLNDEIKQKTIQFRKNSKLRLPDAIIAATASYLQMPLLTADKGFRSIDVIDVIIYESQP